MGAVAMMLAQGATSSPAVTWNPADKAANISLSVGNRTATKTTDNANACVRATLGRSSGKYYFEVLMSSALFGGSPFIEIGLATATMSLTGPMNNADGWSYYQNDGNKRHNSTSTAFGSTYTTGDVIAVAVDFDAGEMWWAKNNTWQASGDPAAGTGEAFASLAGVLFPTLKLYRVDATAHSAVGRFKGSDFSYSPPSGFSAWDS